MNHWNLLRNPREDEPYARDLRRRLDEFYATTTKYVAFAEGGAGDQKSYHRAVIDLIEPMLRDRPPGARVRVLELGAGRTNFARNLGPLRDRVEFHAQDVTPANEAFLRQEADAVHIGDVRGIGAEFDVVFSTFVVEHVVAPEPFLEQVRRMLRVGGWHVVICPRYDMPGFVCPSLRHLSKARQAAVCGFLFGSRLAAAVDRRPRFWVNGDPSMFHRPWFRDADAVHLVSRIDVEAWHRRNGFTVRRIKLPVDGGWRLWVLLRLLLVSGAYQRVR